MRSRLVRALPLAAVTVLSLHGQSIPPVINSVQPNRAAAGSPQITIFVSGTGFGSCSKVQWNGADLPTQQSPNGLNATVAATLLAVPGSAAVRVFRYDNLEVACSTSSGVPSSPFDFFIQANAVSWVTAATLPAGVTGVPYSTLLQATGGVAPINYALAEGSSLPPGLTLSAAGLLAGTPTAAGTFTFTVEATDSCPEETPFCTQTTVERTFSLSVSAQTVNPISIVTTALAQARVGQLYTQQLVAQGGTAPVSWSVTAGALPPGVGLQNNTGIISGIPAFGGNFTFQATVRDAVGATATRTFTIEALNQITINTDGLPQGTVGRSYSFGVSASGGVVPFRFQAVNLPPGLVMDQFGFIAGVPQAAGTFEVTVRATDAVGVSSTKAFLLTVNAELRILNEAFPEGRTGVLFNQTLAATGGRPPYNWAVVGPSILPTGLTLNALSGQLAGIPSVTGEFDVRFRVADLNNTQVEKVLRIIIRSPFSITSEQLPAAAVGSAYSFAIQTAGGQAPLRWSLPAGSFPEGLTLDPATGAIAGTPARAGSFGLSVLAIDGSGNEARKSYTLIVRERLLIIPGTLPAGETGVPYLQSVTASGGEGSFVWSISEGALPDGLRLESTTTTATITGTPTREARFAFTLRATDTAGQAISQRYLIRIAAPLRLLTDALPPGAVGAPYAATLLAEGGEAPYSWSILTGALPPGSQFEGSGLFSGTLTQAGLFRFTAEVRDDAGRTVTRALSIEVAASLRVNPDSLPAATAGMPYRQTLSVDGDAPGLAWQVSQGSLPGGLSLDFSTGVISGVAQRAGTASFTVRAAASNGAFGTRQYTLSVNALELPDFTITPNSAAPGQQPLVNVSLESAAPVEILGTVRLAFTPESGPPDPAVRFSSGDGATARFTVPAGQLQAQFPDNLAIQTGTVAGTITLTLELTANGVPVTPSPAPTRVIRIARAAPVITSLRATRNATGVTVEIVGFSTAREVTSGEFQFSGQPAASFTVALTQVVSGWYQDPRSREFGSLFRLTMPFTVTGSPAQVTQVAVTLVNSLGRSETRTAAVE
ncbi:MAG: Ig domain-containing protein [Bryobacteraceae bacterium]|nr:Ig domain-containing protein [Bryobacteraceae bacterium]